MLSEEVLERFRALEAHDQLDDANIEETCAAIAAIREPSRDAIRALCDIATMPGERRRTAGQRAIFTAIVERLSDSFEPADVAIYDRIFAQIIDDCRRRPAGKAIDQTLNRFGIHNEQGVLDRKKRLSRQQGFVAEERNAAAVQRVFVLSRVTLGADVALTSVIMNGLAMMFPGAVITLVGPPPIGELYETAGPFHVLDAPYERRGALIDRLNNWVDLVDLLDRERRGLKSSEYLIVDPDSRLTQLGLLPVTADEGNYFFFESRSCQRPGKERLAELAGAWQRETFGGGSSPVPFVWINARDTMLGQQASRRLRGPETAGVIAFNFGAGGNDSKRLGLEFETRLVMEALRRRYAVILDCGVGAERDRANHIVEQCRAGGRRVIQLDGANAFSRLNAPDDGPIEALTWEGGPGPFAGLIACADLYAGYDSAFQHISAALGRPVIDIFVRQMNERFIARWTPYSNLPEPAVQVARLDQAIGADDAVQKILSLIPQSPYRRQSARDGADSF
jgi:ADP-heptose:LPS heptosyltransferase